MQSVLTRKHYLYLFLFFACLALAMLSPIASNQYIPAGSDFANHLVNISQAKKALDQGQFPIQIAPELYHGWGYAYFQFYSPLVYTVTGAIYKWFTPSNPFIAFKTILWLMLALAGLYVFRLVNEFITSTGVALLAAVLYVMSPYLLANINARGDLTESIAVCIVPIALFYSIQLQRRPTLRGFIFTAIAWFALITTHVVTFVFSSLFIGLFMVIMNIQEQIPLWRLIILGIAYFLSWILALWYVAPIVLLQPYVYAHHALCNPYFYRWLNPLSTMLAPVAVSPMPMPGNGKLYCPFYVAIGWPILMAVGLSLYYKIQASKTKVPGFITPLLCLFFLALFLAWSPVNFWIFLPEMVKSVQFGFRFMVQILWIGIILFAWSVETTFQHKFDLRYVVLGILLIGMMNSSWLMTGNSSNKTIADIVDHPKHYDWGADAFVISPLLFPHEQAPANTLSVAQTQNHCQQQGPITNCKFSITTPNQSVQLPVLYYPGMLSVTLNGKAIAYEPIALSNAKTGPLDFNPMLVGVKLNPGNYVVSAHYRGLAWANYLSAGAWGILLAFFFMDFLRRLKG